MGYEVLAVNPETGVVIAELTTTVDHTPAHMLMSALGVDYSTEEEMGTGDCYRFIDAELSAAEAALFVATHNSSEEIHLARAMSFLATTRAWMKQVAAQHLIDVGTVEVEIGFF